MKEDWKRFYIPMVVLLASLIAVACWSYWRYGASFWENFYAPFLATAFGVAFTVLFTVAIWRYQQRAQKSRQLQQLLEDLRLELDENSKRLEHIDDEFEKDEDKNQNMVSVSMLMRGYSIGGVSFRFLRTVAMEQILKPENLVLIKDFTLEENVEWLSWRCKQFNAVLSQALKELETELESGKVRQ